MPRRGAKGRRMGGRIFVCVTCDRYASPAADRPSPGRALAGAVAARVQAGGETLTVRTVECLNGCPHPCTAALRMPGKCTIRFSGLTIEDVPALIQAAQDYAESADGNLPAEAMPPRLRGKISLRVALPAGQAVP